MHTSVLSPSNPMVALLYDDMTQAPVGTIGEEVWILPPVSVVADPVAWGRGTEYEAGDQTQRSEEHTSELQSLRHLVCRLLLEKKNNQTSKRVCRHMVGAQ